MKPELTPELKARFFALYWGQKALVTKGSYNHPVGKELPINSTYLQLFLNAPKMRSVLLLRPISAITDEEAIEVAKMGGYEISFAMPAVDVRKHLLQQITNDSRWTTIGSHHIDYLRSIGIALPCMGYSVEELVEAGWVKLVEP